MKNNIYLVNIKYTKMNQLVVVARNKDEASKKVLELYESIPIEKEDGSYKQKLKSCKVTKIY